MVCKTIAVSITEKQYKWLKANKYYSPSTLLQQSIEQKMNEDSMASILKQISDSSPTLKNIIEEMRSKLCQK